MDKTGDGSTQKAQKTQKTQKKREHVKKKIIRKGVRRGHCFDDDVSKLMVTS